MHAESDFYYGSVFVDFHRTHNNVTATDGHMNEELCSNILKTTRLRSRSKINDSQYRYRETSERARVTKKMSLYIECATSLIQTLEHTVCC